MSKKTPKIKIAKYHMSLHFGVCLGPVDAVFGVYADKKEVWTGTITANQTVSVDKEELFGGLRKEGGVKGDLHFLLGGMSQTLDSFLTEKLGRTVTTSSFYRGVFTLFLTETPGDPQGMYLKASSPVPPNISVKVARWPDEWYPSKAIIGFIMGPQGQLEIQTFGNQEQMTDYWEGTNGSTTDYWSDDYGNLQTQSFFTYDGFRHQFRHNAKTFQNLSPPIPDAIHSASSNENEEWSGALHLAKMPTDGLQRLNEQHYPGYLFGLTAGFLHATFYRPSMPNTFWATIYEYNYDETRLTRFTRENANSNWIADDHTNAANFLRLDQIYVMGNDDSGNLVCWYETAPADYVQIRSNAPPFGLLNGPNGYLNENSVTPWTKTAPEDCCRVPNNLWMQIDYETDYSTSYSQNNELLVYTLDLGTGAQVFRNSSLWGPTTGPYSEANVRAPGVYSGPGLNPAFAFPMYDRENDKIIFVFQLPGEFSDWNTGSNLNYYEYAWGTCNGDFTGWVWHGYFPWSGLRKADGTRAANAAEATFCRTPVQFGFEHHRNFTIDAMGAKYMQVSAQANYRTVVSSVLGSPSNPSPHPSPSNNASTVFAFDLANGGALVGEIKDTDELLPFRADFGSPWPLRDLVGAASSAQGNLNTEWHYDPDCKVVSGYSFTNYAVWYATWRDKNTASRFGSNDPPPPLEFAYNELTPFFHLALEPTQVQCAQANPAHIIYDVLTNTEYGMGIAASSLDDAAFRTAADTLYDENFGLSMLWVEQATGETFIQEVIDHIEAVLYVDPNTGLLVLKLIRGDYDAATLPKLNNSNAKIENFRRQGIGELINQITVTYTNDDNEEAATVVVQDQGLVAQQGNVVNDDRNYYGIRSSALATTVGWRDLRVASYPLATMEAELSHENWNVVPGQVFSLDWTFRDGKTISDMAVRVTEVDRSHKGGSAIRVGLTQDIFALEAASFTVLPTGEPIIVPEAPAELEHIQFFSLPYYMGVNLIDPEITFDEAAEETFLGILGATSSTDTSAYEVYGQGTDSLGTTAYTTFGENDLVQRSVLGEALVEEITTTLAGGFPSPTKGPSPIVGTFVLISDGPEADHEIAIITAVTPSIVLKRGMLDTTPRAWPISTPVWLINPDADIVDNEPYAAPQSGIKYKLLPRTSQGLLALADATEQSVSIEPRHYLPLRPANVKVQSVGFGSVDGRGLSSFNVTWARRNRLTEDSIVNYWDDADVTAEAGTTVTVQALNLAKDTVLGSDTGLTGTAWSFPVSKFGAVSEGYIRVISERGADQSWQGHDIHVFFNVVGVGAVSLPVPQLNAAGGSGDIVGSGAISTPIPALSASGTIVKVATGAITLPLPTLSAAGEQIMKSSGAINTTLPQLDGIAFALASGVNVVGFGGVITPLPTLTATGELTRTGSGAISTIVPVLNGAGDVVRTGSGAITAPVPTLNGSGTVTP